ncbi:hypothetical protein FGO68_gene13405 [Halteria grandinella]|uniref:Uncharacterized protein n=1 Tax=Halteria grandinella TaxID=5974 RepID=A0A8J8N9K3_HALGN|nr:hypothetical protein FGO68_gene13405 [Halteria grandinella]
MSCSYSLAASLYWCSYSVCLCYAMPSATPWVQRRYSVVSWPNLNSLVMFLSLIFFKSDFSSWAKVTFCSNLSSLSMSVSLISLSMSTSEMAFQSSLPLFSENLNLSSEGISGKLAPWL